MHKPDLRPKQSLGQNFLLDANVAAKIVSHCHFSSSDVVIEIGPGLGALTERIAPLVDRLIAIEIDRRLVERLRAKLGDLSNVEIVHQDFLKVDTSSFSRSGQLRIVGNIPYHITSPILFKMIDSPTRVKDLTLLMQKEVANRLIASPRSKEYGILSVVVQTYTQPQILFHVPRTVFRPRPQVDSSLVRLEFQEPHQDIVDHELFRQLVRTAFGQRRKMLRKSLNTLIEQNVLQEDELQKRPEELSVNEWINLSNRIAALNGRAHHR